MNQYIRTSTVKKQSNIESIEIRIKNIKVLQLALQDIKILH